MCGSVFLRAVESIMRSFGCRNLLCGKLGAQLAALLYGFTATGYMDRLGIDSGL